MIDTLGRPLSYAIMVAVALSLGSLLSNAPGVGEPSDTVHVTLSGITGAVVGDAFGWWRQRRGKKR